MDLTLQLLSAASVIGGLALASAWLRRKAAELAPRKRLAVIERVQLGSACHLVMVRWDGQELLLAAGAQSCTLLGSQSCRPVPPPAVPLAGRKDLHACAG